MAFSYSGNPNESPLDWLRFTIGDINAASPMLQDAELNYIIDLYPDMPSRQLAVAFRQCANVLATKATKRKLGPQSEDTTDRLRYYTQMADKYEKSTLGGIPPLPDYNSEKVFDKGMMANDV